MYSRYKIQIPTPAPPPDYAGTAFKREGPTQPVGEDAAEEPTDRVQSEPESVVSAEPGKDAAPEVRWDGPSDIFLSEEDTSEEEPESAIEASGDAPEGGSAGEDPDAGSLLAGMDPDDLLFIGAMLYLLSGKNGNDSFLLLAYLLTCGL